MDRIATNSAYNAVLSNIMNAEIAQSNAGNQISSTEKATDLKGYGTGAESLTAMQATSTQVTGYLNNTQLISAKLSTQDSALSQVSGAADSAVASITQAIAVGNSTGLMQQLQNAFGSAVEGLNTTYNGEYLFSGGQVNTQPVSATQLSDLTAQPVASSFHNDQRQITTQVDANTTVATGFLADKVGTPLFNAFQAIEAYNQPPTGPLTGQLTTTQQAFLTQQIATLNTVQAGLNTVVGQNGQAQDQVTNMQSDLTSRQTMLAGLIGNVTQADLAQADANLQQAQLSIQAAGQVFQALNASSLLNTLAPSGGIA
ncbi:MAG TPA: flagellin [Caulobacteraceae bacterium]|jgi:flagellar hook-associated protein 3 FlgL